MVMIKLIFVQGIYVKNICVEFSWQVIWREYIKMLYSTKEWEQ